MTRVAVLDFGMGNLRSVAKAVEWAGGEAVVTSRPAEAERSDALVVPGVGAFAACMDGLRSRGLDELVRTYVRSDRPVLAVCLGMQVLFEHSEEGDAPGLGLLRGRVARLPGSVTVPHMGWNDVTWSQAHPLVDGLPDGTRFYFVHSYVCLPADDEVTVGQTEHGMRFAAAVAAGNVFATQFHPEKSSHSGLEIYRNLVKAAA
ncbi:MAG TPA: imidazole glycerol phosphate synthase subunit HisH [Actinomycetota bacterium]|nr:imidazole glycerol phosphate synthase subunit HisH [Actinomycetota bacterium]